MIAMQEYKRQPRLRHADRCKYSPGRRCRIMRECPLPDVGQLGMVKSLDMIDALAKSLFEPEQELP